jgi:hypothetical protein
MRPMRLPTWRYAGSMDDEKDRDERISLKPLTGEEALRALLQVDPEAEPVDEDREPPQGDPLADAAE